MKRLSRHALVLLWWAQAWWPGAQAQDADMAAFERLHAASEAIYDGAGVWGYRRYGYRMPLRDAAWRADVYGHLAQHDGIAAAARYRQRANEAIEHLLAAQRAGGTGVFGFPAEAGHPEFGAVVRAALRRCPACVHNGWVVALPGRDVAELYYDHGHALVAVARAYRRSGDAALLAPLRQAADWALPQPLTHNVNYLSSLAKGLSHAWQATGDPRYLERAVELHRQGILPSIGPEGEARDRHNARLEYHGFIVSGLVALQASLPVGHPAGAEVQAALQATAERMADRGLQEPGDDGATWPGTTLIAWQELAALRTLTPKEAQARDRARALIRATVPRIEVERNGFRLRKALYSYFMIGWLP